MSILSHLETYVAATNPPTTQGLCRFCNLGDSRDPHYDIVAHAFNKWGQSQGMRPGAGYVVKLNDVNIPMLGSNQAIAQYDEFGLHGLKWEHGRAFFEKRQDLARYLIQHIQSSNL